MSARVSLSRRDGEVVLGLLDADTMEPGSRLLAVRERLRAALTPSPRKVAAKRAGAAVKRAKRASKNEETARIRAADLLAGGSYRGRRASNASLTDENVADVIRRLGDGERQVDVARDLGVSRSAINAIAKGRSWTHVAEALMTQAEATR